jgi:hypothetical protein
MNRKHLIRKIVEGSGLSLPELESDRLQLAALAPAVLLRHWFGKLEPKDPRSSTRAKLRQVIRRRSELFEWVYASDSPIARDLLYVRLPSGEKRRLVSFLLAEARPRLPWLDSQTIHAMAFRPSAFGGKQGKLPTATSIPWGALYRRVGIPKGSGKRVLTIPNPPLMQIHRALLRLIGPGLESSMSPQVFGAKRGVPGPIFRNAAAHRKATYVASFDLKDFFPSVRVGDIIRGFKSVAKQGTPMLDSSSLEHTTLVNIQHRKLSWTNDAMLLIARLCTHRSRLPQGAPLSPLLANVAFASFDRRISRQLRERFGAGDFQYTRYFDDITISLNREAVLKCRIKSTAEAMRQIEECVASELAGSSFTLNPSKSRCTRLRLTRGTGDKVAGDSAAEVTGLLVRDGNVSLSRELKRWIRDTSFRLKHRSFVDAARDWAASTKRPSAEWQSPERGYRWKQTPNFHRRCSAERLAVLMLERTNPDLRVRVINREWNEWQAQIEMGADMRVGRAIRQPLQALLRAHWRGDASVRQGQSNELIFSHQGVDLCAVSSESDLRFLFLGAEDAIRVADYWHHLHGMRSYLQSCPAEPEFEEIHRWRDKFTESLRSVRLGYVETLSRENSQKSVDGFVWFVKDALDREVHEVFNRYCDFSRSLGNSPSGAWARLQSAFSRRVEDEQTLSDWLCAVSQLTVRSLPRLPNRIRCAHEVNGEEFFEYLRLREDLALGRIHADYRALQKFDTTLGLRDERVATPERMLRGQMTVLKWLSDGFREQGAAVGSLYSNRWAVSLGDQVESSFLRLAELLPELRSSTSQRRLFDQESGSQLLRERPLIVAPPASATSEESWRHLFDVARALCMATREVIEPDLCRECIEPKPDSPHPNQIRRNKVWKKLEELVPAKKVELKLLHWLRNRCVHPPTPEQRRHWLLLQNKVNETLGREWESSTGLNCEKFSADDDLKLTGYEAMLVKAELLEALRAVLEVAREKEVWEEWSGATKK